MTKITFEDLPSTNTPLNASNLNTMQTNIDNEKLEKKVNAFTGDYNDLTDIGFYYADGSSTNSPASGYSHYVTVYKLSNSFIYQVAYRVTNTVEAQYLFVRQNYNGIWTTWRAIGGKILWANSNPSSNFAAQSITLSSSDYNFLEWVFLDGNNTFSIKTAKGYGCFPYILVQEASGGYFGFRMRKITRTNDTEFAVSAGTIKYANKTSAEADTYATIVKPLYVIGY